jgi:hypothetical protein
VRSSRALLIVVAMTMAETSLQAQTTVPSWARAILVTSAFAANYQQIDKLTPAFLTGDFNGDGRADVAVFVLRTTTREQGIAIIHAGATKPVVLGAGREFGNGGTDFSWLDAWRVDARVRTKTSAATTGAKPLRGDVLFVEKREAASATIYWDGTRYRWRQLGD